MLEKKIKWGILGTADIAKKRVLPAMENAVNAKLYAIAGRSSEKVEEFKREFGFKKTYLSYEELLADEKVEAVYIPLPNSLHKEWVIKAAKAGKHVLCEKPMAGCEADVKEMIEACKENNVILMEAFAYLHSPAIKAVKETLDSGIIGEANYIETLFFITNRKENDIRLQRETLGGSVYDLGCYNISFILKMMGKEPDFVKAVAHFTKEGIDDYATGLFQFENGCKATVSCGLCSPQQSENLIIHGTKGMIKLDIPFNASGKLSYTILKPEEKPVVKTMKVPNNYVLEVEQFGRCILDDEYPAVSNEFSLMNARTIDKVLESMGY